MVPAMNAELLRAERIQADILRMLWTWSGTGVEPQLPVEEIINKLSSAPMKVGNAEINTCLNYLVGLQMARAKWDDRENAWMIAIAPKGTNFVRAGLPWEKVNEFHPYHTPPTSDD